MKLWPYDSFKVKTTLSPEEIVALLHPRVEPRKLFRASSTHTEFQGDLHEKGFRISRIIHYRNSFLPIVTGTFHPEEGGTTVAIRMELHPLVLAFLCVWVGALGLFTLPALMNLLLDGAFHLGALAPLGMLVLGWALTLGGFWFEAKKQRRILLEAFKAKEA